MSARSVMDSLCVLSPVLINFLLMACQELQWRVRLNSPLPSRPWWDIPRSSPITHLNGLWWIPPINETHCSGLIRSAGGILIFGWCLIPSMQVFVFCWKCFLLYSTVVGLLKFCGETTTSNEWFSRFIYFEILDRLPIMLLGLTLCLNFSLLYIKKHFGLIERM